MAKNTKAVLRDVSKDEAYYESCIELLEAQAAQHLKHGATKLLISVADYYLRAARAAYSAGKSITQSKRYLRKASEYYIKYFASKTPERLSGLMELGEYLEAFSAAYMVDQAGELITAFRAVLPLKLAPVQIGVLEPLCALLMHEKLPKLSVEEMSAVAKSKLYAHLPAVFDAVYVHDGAAVSASLDAYLIEGWGPSADRAARVDLKSPYPIYTGLWSFFSAAMCTHSKTKPAVSKKTLRYLPIELIWL